MSRSSFPAGLANEDATLSDRVVKLTTADGGTTFNLTPETHANRLIVLDPALGPATINLPFAYGTGDVYEIVLAAAVGSGSIVINATHHGTTSCKILGSVTSIDSSNATADVFLSSTNDIMTLTPANTGGAGGDYIKLVDVGSQVWRTVGCVVHHTGDTPATPFSG